MLYECHFSLRFYSDSSLLQHKGLNLLRVNVQFLRCVLDDIMKRQALFGVGKLLGHVLDGSY